ncbi:hypothetical protein ABW286_11365 [Erwinia papayae]|uniref:Beta-ketoacyl-[acyl-carrier-protein] synthase III N-terminal domain-containing protein n=1 Tax=Erwinia papayae TaxID=206499 RepID=A0ABV3N1S8_9GAMM
MAQHPCAQARIVAPDYQLGEQPLSYEQIPDWQQRAAAFSLPALPQVWGWGTVHQATSSFIQLAVASASKTLADTPAQQVDTVIFCSSSLPADANQQTRLLCDFADALALHHAEIIGVTLGRCTNLLKGLRLAEARIASGQSTQILLVASDCMEDPAQRLENFALFSDGAASCLVVRHDDPRPGFDILASAEQQDLKLIPEGLSSALATAVNQQLFRDTQITLADVSRLFHTNVFLPLCNLKERQAGYAEHQLFTDNIVRIGHCFSADPLINLTDAIRRQPLPEQGIFQLAASIPGARAAVLLQKRREE